jgi:SAM-dependent methyltransferase
MSLAKLFYEIGYRYFHMPWDIGPRTELVELVESGRIKPCRAIDLGSGTASNCIFLAQHGFDVTGVDYVESAVELGKARVKEVGVSVTFVLDDLTNLEHVHGTYDLLVDYGTLDDLTKEDRDLYMQNVLSLTHPGSLFLLYAFEWPVRWWERPFYSSLALELGEAERRFGEFFEIERIAGETSSNLLQYPRGYAVYLMTRLGV